MARLFNVEIFNKTISGAGANAPFYYSSDDHAALLGSADVLTFQVILSSAKNVSTQVIVTYQWNNTLEQENWMTTGAGATTTSGATFADMPALNYFTVKDAIGLGAYGRIRVSSDKEEVTVRVIACGRVN